MFYLNVNLRVCRSFNQFRLFTVLQHTEIKLIYLEFPYLIRFR